VLLLARDEAYAILTWVMVAPLTTTLRSIPTAVPLDPHADGVPQPCVVSLDNVQAIRSEWISDRITQLSREKVAAVDRALHFALGLRQ